MTYSHMQRALIYINVFHIYICAPFYIPIHTSDVPQYNYMWRFSFVDISHIWYIVTYIHISRTYMCPFLCIYISYIYISTDDMAHAHMCERATHSHLCEYVIHECGMPRLYTNLWHQQISWCCSVVWHNIFMHVTYVNMLVMSHIWTRHVLHSERGMSHEYVI